MGNDYMLTEDKLKWIRSVLSDDNPGEISPSYFYKIKTNFERNRIKGNVRKELDRLREKIKVTPQELLEFRNEDVRANLHLYNFPGIYIIHNCVKDVYYVGQAESVIDRVYRHFVRNGGNPAIYKDYCLGDEFSVSLISLGNTLFSSLNELEDNAIRAFDSFPNGYNRQPGNVLDKHIFKSDDYQKVADLLLDRIKGTEAFSNLTNNRKRIDYTRNLLRTLKLPFNWGFILGLVQMIKECQKAKKGIK